MTRSEQKRKAILDAAKKEFIENGFMAANMNDVCASAEVSKRTLYRHFASKEVLFEAVLAIVQDGVERAGHYPYHSDRSVQQQLTAITFNEVNVSYDVYGIAFSRTIIMEFFRQPELAKNMSQRIYETRAVTRWFEQAIDDGKLCAKDAQTITSFYLSVLQGLLFWPQVLDLGSKPDEETLQEKVELIVSSVLKTFAPES
ncbi:DNA-binding transcriptional repressor AcrR [Vibrio thalassae]|uniref:DNA-binding transcriptional repressor AcrR n=1 Tax=Vibrio thalassae TaxID=1243014 RepID=A0A240EMK9_9VIBR|nr:TetR/AcrR family transcriptional regulator [Vibrio thalassae]SNX49846.1 DNA-binding transcriptional repressor AcrR [Vibrio thalassae]